MTWQDVDGWLTPEEGLALQTLAVGAMALEFGSYRGRSTCCLAAVASSVVAVDHFKGDAGTGPGDTHGDFVANLEACGVRGKVLDVRVDLDGAAPVLPERHFDLVFVDDAHDTPSVVRSTRLALACVAPGGTVAWHDWDRPSVRAGVLACGVAPTATRGSLAWVTAP